MNEARHRRIAHARQLARKTASWPARRLRHTRNVREAGTMKSYYDVRDWMVDHGWSESKRDSDARSVTWTKRVKGVWVRAIALRGGYARQVILLVRPPKRLKGDAREAARDELRAEVSTDQLGRELALKARELAKRYRELSPGRKQRTFEDFKWRGKTGREAWNTWRAAAARVALRVLDDRYRAWERARQRGERDTSYGASTRDLTDDVLVDHGMLPRGVTSKRARKDFRAVMKKLERGGFVEKEGREWVRFPDLREY